jgi:hypothetical protein
VSDGVDPNPTITVSPAPDSNQLGDQQVVYSATDAAGNEAEAVLRVYRVRMGISGTVFYQGLQQGDT